MSDSVRYDERMSPSDALLWNNELDPMLRSTILSVMLLEGAPDPGRFERVLARSIERVPRLRQRVVLDPLGAAPPRWERDPLFDPGYHVRRVSVAGEGTLLRIELRLAGDDPRIALRERLPEHAELEAIVMRLARIDAASPTAWTTRYLQLVADQPGIVSRVLAPQVDADVPPFKRRVRQLKELGLTESLEVGYRLSPRGRAVLECLVSNPR